MKRKKIKKILALTLASMMLCGCQQTSPAGDETKEPAVEGEVQGEKQEEEELLYQPNQEEFLSMKDFFDYLPRAPLSGVTTDGNYFQLGNVGDHTVMQGGCSDGTYMYLILENNKEKTDIIFKVDMSTWEIVKQSEPLPLHHGNGMGYNSKTNEILVSHNTGAPKDVSIIDPETLTIKKTFSLDYGIYGIAYNEKRDCYVIGLSGLSAFAVLDSNFVELGYYEGHSIGLANQSVSCDDDYIYVGNSGVGSNPGMEVVKIYNWMGEYQGIFRVDSVSEQEAFIPINGKNYITFFTGNGGRVYEIDIDYSQLAE